MKKISAFFSKIKLTQDLSGFDYFENFLVSTVLTILGVRFFLQISGYPQIGGGGLHIAHMLWGGLFLLICLLLELLFLDRRIKAFAAVLGGIGFGLFIDEIGKFLTADNNYFFQPSVAIMYVFFVVLFLIMHFMKTHMTISKEEYVSNALDIFRNGLVHGLTDNEEELFKKFLKESGDDFTLESLSAATKTKIVDRKEAFVFFSRFITRIEDFFKILVSRRTFQVAMVIIVEIQAIFSFFLAVFVVLYYSGIFPEHIASRLVLDLDFASTAVIVSSFIAGALAIAGALSFPRSRKRAFTLIKYSLFISIFIVQFFIFWVDQFGALVGLVLNVLALQAVNVILQKYSHSD